MNPAMNGYFNGNNNNNFNNMNMAMNPNMNLLQGLMQNMTNPYLSVLSLDSLRNTQYNDTQAMFLKMLNNSKATTMMPTPNLYGFPNQMFNGTMNPNPSTNGNTTLPNYANTNTNTNTNANKNAYTFQ